MQREKLDQTQLDERRTQFEQIRRHVSDGNGHISVQFQFNLNPALVGESIFVIFSNRSQAAVYKGPYQASVVVNVDGSLSTDEGYDSLEFWLLQLAEKQTCVWVNEHGEPYWRPGAQMIIELLQEPTLDDEGFPKSFDVTIR